MNLVTAVRSSIRRPILHSLLAVSLASLAAFLYHVADPPKQQARKMHIESIPMCKLDQTSRWMIGALRRAV